MTYHLVARARPGQLLFADATEGARLWKAVLTAAPEPIALTLMPNHVHLVHPHDVRRRLGGALGRYVRWRHHRRGLTGPCLQRLPPAELLADRSKRRRAVRYVHLNPCRARLVDDPLAWPWSTHRDAVGLALQPAIPRAAQPHRFHAYVSGDPTVHPEGTELPQPGGPPPSPSLLRAVMASMARQPEAVLRQRGPWRRLFLGVGYALCEVPQTEVRAAAGVGKGAVVPTPPRHVVHAVDRAVHDPRMQHPLPWARRWAA